MVYEYDSTNGYKHKHKNHFDINWAFISFGHILKTPLLMKLCGKSGGNPKDIAKQVIDHLNQKEYEEITKFTCDNAFICIHFKPDFELTERVHLSLKQAKRHQKTDKFTQTEMV